ncbi:uncharacterized protein M421DRAFT_91467 [Didymella exigua CBS 183.55]|uniref:Uncharacterized protein n=1 Tax=Didymella exigua CBS 183.55 TaxID=1150837 RepID=A0A6A5RRE5_9PLEO|nr:uncharacterized protein M421DRAFT_91467 [Didymella exigua CBS 183.55]KAF1929624.1 hypothetical protein M421DRAFT_91467 [Didymella exigua CBS 183.55]
MAPPRTAKQPRRAAEQTTSRQDRNARRQAVEEVDKDTDADEPIDAGYETEDNNVDPSQGTAVQNMSIGVLSNQAKCHIANKKQVKKKFSLAKTELQNNIITLFEEHEEQADTAHSAQLKRLADLIALKASLESQMTTKLAHLQTEYETHSRELSGIIEARIRELKR